MFQFDEIGGHEEKIDKKSTIPVTPLKPITCDYELNM